jgi:RHH-type transcriptional regulator, rel operon repressor / antitoxin RelB
MICVQLDERLEKRLDALCRATKRKKEDYLRQALEDLLDEQEDILIARSRLRESSDPVISLEEMRKRLDLDR